MQRIVDVNVGRAFFGSDSLQLGVECGSNGILLGVGRGGQRNDVDVGLGRLSLRFVNNEAVVILVLTANTVEKEDFRRFMLLVLQGGANDVAGNGQSNAAPWLQRQARRR